MGTLFCPTHVCFPCWSTAFPAQGIARHILRCLLQKHCCAQSTLCTEYLQRNKRHLGTLCHKWHLGAACRAVAPQPCVLQAVLLLPCLCSGLPADQGTPHARRAPSTGDRELGQQVCSGRGKAPSQDCAHWGSSELFFWLHLSKYSIAITTVFFWQANECISSVLQASFEHKREWFRCSREEKASFYNYSSFFQYFALLP